MYFKNFPLMTYLYKVGDKEKLIAVKDITLNVRIRKQILSNITLFEDIDVVDGDTPERIADKIYRNPNYHWIIMLCNERFHYADEFPLSQEQLQRYVEIKYGADNSEAQHMLFGRLHFETADGQVVDEDHPLSEPVSNYEYEFRENEKKRRIKIIHPRLVEQVVSDIEDILENSINE
jgi:hypothetical protein